MERLKGFRQELISGMGRMYLHLGGLSNPEKVAVVAPIALEDVAIMASHEFGDSRLSEVNKVVDEVIRRRTLIQESPAYKRGVQKIKSRRVI